MKSNTPECLLELPTEVDTCKAEGLRELLRKSTDVLHLMSQS